MPAFPKYPQYKDSGVEWLGDVPEHWEVRRNLGIFDERKEANLPNAELLSVTQDRGIIRQSEITAKKDSSNDDKTKYKVVKVGDLAYNKMRAWQGALGISDYDGIVSPAYVVLTPRNPKLSKFFHYLFRTNEFITEANRLSYGLCGDMNSLRYEHFKTSYSVIPPDQDIDRIVAFLDEKTAEIDRLIAKKQRQIELLDEQKAILINRAVTRGLHPQAELQDSGIPWIGPIPKGWRLKRMRYLCTIGTGECDTKDSIPNGNYPFFVRSQTPERINSFGFDCEAILTAGDGAGVGKVFHHYIGKFDCHQRVYVMRDFTEVSGRFLFLYMRENFHRVALTGEAKSTVDSLRRTMLTDFPVPIPSPGEQADIINHCDQASDATAILIKKVESQIQTLQTLRSTLIAHAVTGKIKV